MATVGLAVVAIVCSSSASDQALLGGVRIQGSEMRWGQYRSLKAVTGVECPRISPGSEDSQSLPNRIKDYPCNGASAVLVYCQEPGRPFFTPDGKGIAEAELSALQDSVAALYRFDMLPILVLFDPDPSCRLASQEAYVAAAQTLVEGLKPYGWFLLCVSDRCGDLRWSESGTPVDAVEVARNVARTLTEADEQQVVAAGAGTAEVNDRLLEGDSKIGVLVGRVEELGLGEGALKLGEKPVVETIEASSLDLGKVKAAFKKVGIVRIDQEFPYGFAVCFRDVPPAERGAARDWFLGLLHEAVDSVQKEVSNGLPPEEGDSFSLKPGEAEEGFVSLFNGKDLSGWVPIAQPGNFVAEDGVIRTERLKGGWLRSWEPYSDFILRAEYWIEEKGNSGIFVRAPLVGRESRIGFEFQIMGESKEAPVNDQSTGSIYYVRAPEANFVRFGDWNEVEITCIGTEVKIVWNGELAHHFRYEDIDWMKNRSLRGYIGLQDHYDVVRFRNLRIKELE